MSIFHPALASCEGQLHFPAEAHRLQGHLIPGACERVVLVRRIDEVIVKQPQREQIPVLGAFGHLAADPFPIPVRLQHAFAEQDHLPEVALREDALVFHDERHIPEQHLLAPDAFRQIAGMRQLCVFDVERRIDVPVGVALLGLFMHAAVELNVRSTLEHAYGDVVMPRSVEL